MPKFQRHAEGTPAIPGRTPQIVTFAWSFRKEFKSLSWRAPAGTNTWAVDNMWISVEFGEFGGIERTSDQPSKD